LKKSAISKSDKIIAFEKCKILMIIAFEKCNKLTNIAFDILYKQCI